MMPRTILHTGNGGAGTTAVAAATARRCAARGLRTLLVSTGPGHGLADALAVPVGPQPVEVAALLSAQEVDAAAASERLGTVAGWLGELLHGRPAGGVPGLPAGLLGLLAVADHQAGHGWDVIVVDCGGARETRGLLALGDVARWWVERLAGEQARLLDAARVLRELPGAEVLDELGALARDVVALDGLLRDHATCSVRVVTAPHRAAVAEARRTLTVLGLHDVHADAVVVNGLLGADAAAPFAARRARQQELVAALEAGVAAMPVLRAPSFAQEVAGAAGLDALGAALFADHDDAAGVLHAGTPEELVIGRDGATLRLALPFAEREGLGLQRIGDALVVSVDGHRRTLRLPAALADYRPSGARLHDGALHVRFDPPA